MESQLSSWGGCIKYSLEDVSVGFSSTLLLIKTCWWTEPRDWWILPNRVGVLKGWIKIQWRNYICHTELFSFFNWEQVLCQGRQTERSNYLQGVVWSYNRSQLHGKDTKCLFGRDQEECSQSTSARVVCSFGYCEFGEKLQDAAKKEWEG